MKIEIIYHSLTGCTEKVARAIFDAIPAEEKSIHNLADGIPVLDADIVLVGYWAMGPGPAKEMKEFLTTVSGKAVGVFATMGYYPDTAYGRAVLEGGISLLKDRNEIIGSFVCSGAVAGSLQKGQDSDGSKTPTQQKQLRWEMIADHPTAAECNLAAQRFRERIDLYTRCKELGIPFQSVV